MKTIYIVIYVSKETNGIRERHFNIHADAMIFSNEVNGSVISINKK